MMKQKLSHRDMCKITSEQIVKAKDRLELEVINALEVFKWETGLIVDEMTWTTTTEALCKRNNSDGTEFHECYCNPKTLIRFQRSFERTKD